MFRFKCNSPLFRSQRAPFNIFSGSAKSWLEVNIAWSEPLRYRLATINVLVLDVKMKQVEQYQQFLCEAFASAARWDVLNEWSMWWTRATQIVCHSDEKIVFQQGKSVTKVIKLWIQHQSYRLNNLRNIRLGTYALSWGVKRFVSLSCDTSTLVFADHHQQAAVVALTQSFTRSRVAVLYRFLRNAWAAVCHKQEQDQAPAGRCLWSVSRTEQSGAGLFYRLLSSKRKA